jgi:hypothetical protein
MPRSMLHVTCVAPVSLAVSMLVAGGCSPAAPASASPDSVTADAVDDSGAKGEKDAGVDMKDDGGLDMKDGGLGTRDDAGVGDDGGVASEDGGSGAVDAGHMGAVDAGPADAGMASGPDAGGNMNACLACAEARCTLPVNACLHSAACVDEGDCDLKCFDEAGGHFPGANSRCIEACTKDALATQQLLAALTCGFWVCPVECLVPLVSCGGTPSAEPPPGAPGCPAKALGAVSH